MEALVENNLSGGRAELEIETKDGLVYIISRAAGEDQASPHVTHSTGKEG